MMNWRLEIDQQNVVKDGQHQWAHDRAAGEEGRLTGEPLKNVHPAVGYVDQDELLVEEGDHHGVGHVKKMSH